MKPKSNQWVLTLRHGIVIPVSKYYAIFDDLLDLVIIRSRGLQANASRAMDAKMTTALLDRLPPNCKIIKPETSLGASRTVQTIRACPAFTTLISSVGSDPAIDAQRAGQVWTQIGGQFWALTYIRCNLWGMTLLLADDVAGGSAHGPSWRPRMPVATRPESR